MVKNLACDTEDTGDVGSIPGLGRSSGGGNGNPLQYSCLENPVDRGALHATVHGVTKNQTPMKQLSMHEHLGIFLVVQWLSLRVPIPGGLGLTPGQGTRSHMPKLKITHATTKIEELKCATKTWCSQINKYLIFKRCVYNELKIVSSQSKSFWSLFS